MVTRNVTTIMSSAALFMYLQLAKKIYNSRSFDSQTISSVRASQWTLTQWYWHKATSPCSYLVDDQK